MYKNRITSQEIFNLIRSPVNYYEVDKYNGLNHLIKYSLPYVKQLISNDKEFYFTLHTDFVPDFADGVNCGLYYQYSHWFLTDFGNCAFMFDSQTVAETAKHSDLIRFKKYVRNLANDLDIKYQKRQENYYLKFKSLTSLQKAFYNMINFEMAYTSVVSFID